MRTISHLPVSVVPGTGRLDPDKSRKTVQHDRAEIRHGEICGLRVGSLFSGIEGFGLGFEQAGCEIVWQVEKEKFCRQVLARHWPKVKRFSDVRRVGAGNLQLVDCITAGVPCQDVSIAGKREGLAGKRTGLFYHFARILQELRPAWFVFENVPGLFSSNEGRDFAEVLRVLMVECGYGVSWRVLDSRYFNVAQRRERVFIVGRLGEPCPAEILFESSSGGGDLAARGEARADIAVPLTSGSGSAGHAPGRRVEDDFNIVAPTLNASFGRKQGLENQHIDNGAGMFVSAPIDGSFAKGGSGKSDFPVGIIAATLRESDGHHGRSSPRGDGSDNLVAFDTTQLTSPANRSNPRPGDPCHPLSSTGHAPAIARSIGGVEGGQDPGAGKGTIVIQDVRGGTRDRTDSGQGIGISEGGPCYTLGATEQHGVCTPTDTDRVRETASLPRGLDSARYRALGNAVTVSVARWIAKRLIAAHERLTYSG